MLLNKTDEATAKKRFQEKLTELRVASQITSISNWTEDGKILLAYSDCFVSYHEPTINVEETLYDMKYYVKVVGKPQINYWHIIMNGYEEDTFPYVTLGYKVTYPGEEYAHLPGGTQSASLPDENGVYYLELKFEELVPGKYVFTTRCCGGMTIIEYGLVEDQS